VSSTVPIEQYWTTKEVAARLKCSKDSVKRWLGNGSLKKTKAGGNTLISETNLQDFLKRSTEKASLQRGVR